MATQPRKWRRPLLLLALGLLAGLAAAEVVVRWTLDPAGTSLAASRAALPRWSALVEAGLFQYADDARLHYTLRPGFTASIEGVTYRINDHGLRGAPVPPRSAAKRLLLVGDSLAFGLGAPEDATLHAHLAKQLSTGSTPVEVLSLGVPAYHTGQAAAWLAQAGPALEADGVLLLYYANDATEPGYHLDPTTGHLYTDETRTPYRWKRGLRRSALYQWWAQGATAAYAHSGVQWPRVEARLDELVEVCRAHGWPLFVVNVPMVRPQAVTRDAAAYAPDLRAAARVAAWASGRGVACTSLGDWLVGLAEQGRLDARLVSPEPGPFYDDHFNGAGNAELAAEVVAALRTSDFLGLD